MQVHAPTGLLQETNAPLVVTVIITESLTRNQDVTAVLWKRSLLLATWRGRTLLVLQVARPQTSARSDGPRGMGISRLQLQAKISASLYLSAILTPSTYRKNHQGISTLRRVPTLQIVYAKAFRHVMFTASTKVSRHRSGLLASLLDGIGSAYP